MLILLGCKVYRIKNNLCFFGLCQVNTSFSVSRLEVGSISRYGEKAQGVRDLFCESEIWSSETQNVLKHWVGMAATWNLRTQEAEKRDPQAKPDS